MGVGEWAKKTEGERLKEAAAAVNILGQKIKLTDDGEIYNIEIIM